VSIEQLKELATIIESVSGDAQHAFIAYLAFSLLKTLLWYGCFVFVASRVFRSIRSFVMIRHVTEKIARHIGISEPCLPREFDAIHAWVDSQTGGRTNK
jgi:hypothetical protein